jgi:hypothetical protein
LLVLRLAGAISGVMVPGAALACPVCFGEAGTGTARGIQAAIAVLGGTTLLAFGAIAVVVVRIRARAATNGHSIGPEAPGAPTPDREPSA